jgi:hypothetical protein
MILEILERQPLLFKVTALDPYRRNLVSVISNDYNYKDKIRPAFAWSCCTNLEFGDIEVARGRGWKCKKANYGTATKCSITQRLCHLT